MKSWITLVAGIGACYIVARACKWTCVQIRLSTAKAELELAEVKDKIAGHPAGQEVS